MANKNTSTFLQGMIVGIIVGVLIAVLMIFITRDSSSQHATATLEKDTSKKSKHLLWHKILLALPHLKRLTPQHRHNKTANMTFIKFYLLIPATKSKLSQQQEPIPLLPHLVQRLPLTRKRHLQNRRWLI